MGEPESGPRESPPPLQLLDSASASHEDHFRGADEEVARILQVQKNFYAVLKVTASHPKAVMRRNYESLMGALSALDSSRADVQEATAAVNLAYGTLTNAMKKRLYDKYLQDCQVCLSSGQSYALWEEEQIRNPPAVPYWAAKVLGLPGGGLMLLCVCFPVTLLCLVLLALLVMITLPLRWCYCCCGKRKKLPDRSFSDGRYGQELETATLGKLSPRRMDAVSEEHENIV